ncbi:MAG: late competence development ComFB family protein [Candidatus Omnitrophica bacterium]|nr:late competence development ComFB family protein [Candidatus Omnitrophota bacterium]
MAGKLKNIIEDIARDHLNSALTLRYDICTCSICKNDMLAFVLSRVPARYVTTEQGALHTIIQQHRLEHQAEIGRAIIEAIDIISKNPRHQLKEDKNKVFLLLLDKIREDRGLDFHHYHQDLLKRRVAIRLRAAGINTYSDYLLLLMKSSEEYDKLFETLCINVSEFFRDPEVWEVLKILVQNMIHQKKTDQNHFIRIWSAGCANGEEPYSIAIMLKEILLAETASLRIEITSTDVDKKCLKFAQKGVYLKSSLKNVPKELLNKYFTSEEDGYKIKDEIKQAVAFSYLDLTSADYIKSTDIVFCRNVFIYFDRNLQEQLLMKFSYALKPLGYLVMGKSETLIREAKEIFQEIDLNARLYRKK